LATKSPYKTRIVWWLAALAVIVTPLTGAVVVGPATAQSTWQWPWEQDNRPRRRPEVERPPPTFRPRDRNAYTQGPNSRPPICLELEQRLAQEANRGSQSRAQLPQINNGIRAARRQVRRVERELDRRECYEQFLFTRSLRRTRVCVKLDRDARAVSRQLQDLTVRKQQIIGGSDRSYQDDIIRELSRYNCGGVYQQEARRRNPFTSFWQDEDSGDRNFRGNTFAGLPFATYRTVCVRLCDGYYFPISFSTLPNHFSRDANACQSRCAAPTELYFHQNPGQSVNQMVSHRSQHAYADLKTAFKYRKEYVRGCSCKQAEFVPGTESQAPRKALAPAPDKDEANARRGSGLSPVR
jgi:hypothetical protein